MFNKGQLAGLMKQAQAMQDNLKKAQEELAHVEITGESVNAFLPQQLNLDQSGSVAFDKGCYPGQEIIARLKYRGQVKSRLIRGISSVTVAAGKRLAPSEKAPTGGTVLACAPAEPAGYRVLAVADLGALDTPLQPDDASGSDHLIHFAPAAFGPT